MSESEMESDSGLASTKYTLRTKSILKRIESEKIRFGSRRKSQKEKQKAPPLSKYRRKTANARERSRMREINEAFITLQQTLPHLPGADSEKLTKITVLRLAVNYIKALAGILDNSAVGSSDIDEVRHIWRLDNAHMARPEHCVRTAAKGRFSDLKGSKSLTYWKGRSKTKSSLSIKSEFPKENFSFETTKKRKASRSKAKVCKTASVMTNNGAYITLKNVALQTINRPGRIPDNQPLMISMTVRKPRMETGHYRPRKMPKLDSTLSVITMTQPQIAFPSLAIEPERQLIPISKQISPFPESERHVQCLTTSPSTFYTFGGQGIKNEIPVIENPKNERHSSVSSSDSAFFSEGSEPASPLSRSTFCATPLGDFSPNTSTTSLVNDMSPYSGLCSDSESVLTAPLEFENLFNCNTFEDELNNLTCSFEEEGDAALKLLFENASSSIMCAEMNE